MTQLVKKRKKLKKNKEAKKLEQEKKFKEEFTYAQTELSVFFNVDRATVARWCRQGLPHERGAHGKEHRIELRTAIHWYIGHKWAAGKNVELSALEKILFGLAHGFAGGKENPIFSHWRLQMMQETNWFESSREEISFAIGRLSGLHCLPFRQSRW